MCMMTAVILAVIALVPTLLPLFSVIGITAVVMAVVAASASTLLTVGVVLVLAVIAHNLLGYALGYAIARGFRLNEPGKRAVSILASDRSVATDISSAAAPSRERVAEAIRNASIGGLRICPSKSSMSL